LTIMGRRALRKIKPGVDLTRNFKTAGELPRPWAPEALFGRRVPVELEIGSGKGLFLRTAALARPEIDFLGIEIVAPYAQFAAAGLARRAIANAVVVAGDAVELFRDWIPAGAVVAVHLYFPDPWWKRRHKKRRVIQETFAPQIERVLAPGGRLHFWTDVEEYYHTALELIARETQLEGPIAVAETPAAGDMDYRTHFERRARLNAQPVYRAEFQKLEIR
jgi:tRNA (guanine-N7-)-methyltransferase